LNHENVEFARRYGIRALVGDATQTDVLNHVDIVRARIVVLTAPNPSPLRRLIHHVRHVGPSALMVARCRYQIYRWELQLANADAVIDEEDQVGQQMVTEIKNMLHVEAS
jgi:CPA2 family monovalent cation:H+ antiporter-2